MSIVLTNTGKTSISLTCSMHIGVSQSVVVNADNAVFWSRVCCPDFERRV